MDFSVPILVRRNQFRTVRDSIPVALDIRVKESVLGYLERPGKYLPIRHHHSSKGLLKASQVRKRFEVQIFKRSFSLRTSACGF